MSWNKVAVVGAGLIKFGELFDQSYEQMAAGAAQQQSDRIEDTQRGELTLALRQRRPI